ncbi:MAG: LysM peptidoglycan-binding domain-containing protein [Chloroflexi bacterium]|nr:MAG: LysM peptidoglycan-binding domain-containing protein [Chloroflexota bacterium]
MYAAGHGIHPWRAPRAGGFRPGRRFAGRVQRATRVLVAIAAVLCLSAGLALAARGSSDTAFTTVVVQPGDTLWSIASDHYPGDDVRIRVQDIEQANGLRGPAIEVGQSLKLPG